MALLVDPRIGSGELGSYLGHLHLPVEITPLTFGDMAFLGTGADEVPVPIGVERKALPDFLSSVQSGRLAGKQLAGLLACYRETWIVIEGDWRIDPLSGHVQTLQWEPSHGGQKPKKKLWQDVDTHTDHALMYRDLESMILTLELKGGVRIRRTKDKPETCRFVAALYHWWTDKSWEQHRSHLKFHSPFADTALLVPPSLCRIVAAQLPGIGFEKSGSVAAHFGSVAAMVAADEKDWAKIKGVGKTLASRIVQALQVAGYVA